MKGFGALAAWCLAAVLCVCVPVLAQESPTQAGSAKPDRASDTAAPMITQNPDGTFAIKKAPPDSRRKTANAKKGLVIPPQLVTPLVLPPDRTEKRTSHE
jgi:hypothetical protein